LDFLYHNHRIRHLECGLFVECIFLIVLSVGQNVRPHHQSVTHKHTPNPSQMQTSAENPDGRLKRTNKGPLESNVAPEVGHRTRLEWRLQLALGQRKVAGLDSKNAAEAVGTKGAACSAGAFLNSSLIQSVVIYMISLC